MPSFLSLFKNNASQKQEASPLPPSILKNPMMPVPTRHTRSLSFSGTQQDIRTATAHRHMSNIGSTPYATTAVSALSNTSQGIANQYPDARFNGTVRLKINSKATTYFDSGHNILNLPFAESAVVQDFGKVYRHSSGEVSLYLGSGRSPVEINFGRDRMLRFGSPSPTNQCTQTVNTTKGTYYIHDTGHDVYIWQAKPSVRAIVNTSSSASVVSSTSTKSSATVRPRTATTTISRSMSHHSSTPSSSAIPARVMQSPLGSSVMSTPKSVATSLNAEAYNAIRQAPRDERTGEKLFAVREPSGQITYKGFPPYAPDQVSYLPRDEALAYQMQNGFK